MHTATQCFNVPAETIRLHARLAVFLTVRVLIDQSGGRETVSFVLAQQQPIRLPVSVNFTPEAKILTDTHTDQPLNAQNFSPITANGLQLAVIYQYRYLIDFPAVRRHMHWRQIQPEIYKSASDGFRLAT